MGDADLQALAADIGANGQHEPIRLYRGKILDGRACAIANAEPRFASYDGADPLAFVISLNLKRRHLCRRA